MSGFNGYSLQYRLSASTTPGVEYQYIRLNNADPTLATHIYISATDQDGASVYAFLTSFNQNSFVILSARDETGRRHIYRIDSVTGDGSTFADYTVTWMSGLGAFGSDWMIQLQFGAAGLSGFSGYSGWSGWSGKSGWSGISGWSGWSGKSGWSGISGWSGWSGKSGWSGISGYSGWSGWSGMAGPSLLSVMAVDVDKDWNGKSITNLAAINGIITANCIKDWQNWDAWYDTGTFDSWLQVYSKQAIGFVASNSYLALGYSGFSGVSANANLLVNGSADASSGLKVGGTEVVASDRTVKAHQINFPDYMAGGDNSNNPGRIFRADRNNGGIVAQLGGTGDSTFDIIDKGWTKVVATVDNTGNAVIAGYVDCQFMRMFRSYQGANQSYVASNWITLSWFNNENYDTHGAWDGIAFVAPVAGLYLFELQTSFVATVTGAVFQMELNSSIGGGVSREKRYCTADNYVRITTIVSAAAGEVFRSKMQCTNNGTIEGGGDKTFFCAYLLTRYA